TVEMKISLTDAGKRFNRDWIFRHFTYTFETGNAYAITGPNGSGKSTLLQVLSGGMLVNQGNIQYAMSNKQCSLDDVYKYISICAPYLEVVEEMTAKEFLHFHAAFKPLLNDLSANAILDAVGLKQAGDKQIRYYSSGMKQRVKLAQCIFSDTPILLLDEPCTNLDAEGIAMYHGLIDQFAKDRLVVVSSNDEVEYGFCKEKISITAYKS
ncbi:MAG TPA: ATP-binding cassette domain-containing protein, partial [Chitinophagaceae bacterium]|nr:ATP-binding cassette domain-containing protein [Chitinophagaceae bacterium]